MQPRPNNPELATAVREFLESEIMPTITDARLKFRTLVAMNALSMLERSNLEEEFLRAEATALARLLETDLELPDSREALDQKVLGLNALLSSQIRAGVVPSGSLEVLRQIAVGKLQVASPNYLKRYVTTEIQK
jgi:ATP-dependent exoDNAse (exonuclease V) alpha subunit